MLNFPRNRKLDVLWPFILYFLLMHTMASILFTVPVKNRTLECFHFSNQIFTVSNFVKFLLQLSFGCFSIKQWFLLLFFWPWDCHNASEMSPFCLQKFCDAYEWWSSNHYIPELSQELTFCVLTASY